MSIQSVPRPLSPFPTEEARQIHHRDWEKGCPCHPPRTPKPSYPILCAPPFPLSCESLGILQKQFPRHTQLNIVYALAAAHGHIAKAKRILEEPQTSAKVNPLKIRNPGQQELNKGFLGEDEVRYPMLEKSTEDMLEELKRLWVEGLPQSQRRQIKRHSGSRYRRY